jgi:hypothetical protein
VISEYSLSPELNANNALPKPLVPLPVKLYKSRDVIFELYDGGKPCRPVTICWERIESIEGMKSPPPDLYRRLEDI